ncbi:MAG TPA: aquaporin, partial [Gemmatimonadales bacterium]|nr:aquaporin [Gemmatimonadales bacterium]
VFGTIVADNAPKVGGFGVGLSLLFIILFAGPLTGGSANPARAFGPALVSGVWTGHLAYWIGPAIGGILAGLFWGYLLLERTRAEAAA